MILLEVYSHLIGYDRVAGGGIVLFKDLSPSLGKNAICLFVGFFGRSEPPSTNCDCCGCKRMKEK